jgi:beta-hydroxylase
MDGTRIFDLGDFPELKPLQDSHATVRDELGRSDRWIKWGSDSADPSGHCRFLSGTWTVFPVYLRAGLHWSEFFNAGDLSGTAGERVGDLFTQLPRLFPRTTELLGRIERINWSGLSRLRPGSRLAPHRHSNPTSLVYHLGVVIPSGGACGLIVGDQVHIWREGDAVLFDDNFLHSAWNDSGEDRIVLYASVRR